MLTKDEAFQEYEEEIARISKKFDEAKNKAKVTLSAHLKAIQTSLHEDLKAVRDIQQRKGR